MIDIISIYIPNNFLVASFLSLQNQTISFGGYKIINFLNDDEESYFLDIIKISADF